MADIKVFLDISFNKVVSKRPKIFGRLLTLGIHAERNLILARSAEYDRVIFATCQVHVYDVAFKI